MPQLPILPQRYQPQRLLGEGATGYVWLAHDSLADASVAIKIVRPNLAKYARFRTRFAREVALSAQVIHPRLVPVYDYGMLFDGRPYVVMGHADQGSLGHLLRWGPPVDEVLRIVDQVLEALAALHARGLVHQDLKPANVLLYSGPMGDINAWIADLGVAGTFSELAIERRGISGTPTWMAPEQLVGRPQELGPWTDLYAMGLMLYEILGGERTPETIGRQQLLEKRLTLPSPLPGDVPPAIFQVIQRLLDPDPRQRYDRAADVRRALRNAREQLGGSDRTAQGSHGGVGPGTTTFPVTILPEAQASIAITHLNITPSGAAPRWNRVPPDVMPPELVEPSLEIPQRASLNLYALREPPMVGQEKIRQFLWQKAREVISGGEPRVVLLVGPEGIGKSTVVESVAVALEAGGYMETIRLRYNRPAGVDDGYRGAVRELLAPWNDTREQMESRLQRWLGRDRQIVPEKAAGEASVLARWCGYIGDGEKPVNAAVGLAYLYRHLDARSWRGGSCLILEDAHLAQVEGDGLAICEALLERSVGQRPVLAMVTISSEAIQEDPVIAAKLGALEAMGAVRINAPRLNRMELREVLVRSFRMDEGLAALVAPVCQGSTGNASLLMRDWSAREILVQTPDMRIKLRPDIRLDSVLPRDLSELCESRISGAMESSANPVAASEALAAAALAGPEPPVSLVRAVNPEGLDSLFATGLLRQQGWRLRFEHAGVQRAAHRLALSRSDLPKLHRRLADAWQELGQRTGADVDLPLGSHSLYANEPGRAMTPLLKAARIAREEGRAAIALDAARLAITAADRAGVMMGRVEARHQTAAALLDLERADKAAQTISEAYALGHLDRRSIARLQVLEARAAIALGQLEQGRRVLEKAKDAFMATRDRQGLIETAHGLGMLFRLAGQPRAAAGCYRQMLRLNNQDRSIEVRALTGLMESRIAAGQLSQLDQFIDRLRRIARESGDTRDIAQSTYSAGLAHLRMHHLEAADRHFQTALALAATLGSDRLQIACINNLGEVYRYRGDLRAAEQCYRRSVRFAMERSWTSIAAVARLNLALLYLTGDGGDRLARAQVDQASELLRTHPQHWAWMFVGLTRAVWAAEDGDHNGCTAWWAVAMERGVERLYHPDLGRPLERLGLAAARHGWEDIARKAAMIAGQVNKTTSVSAEE